LINLGLFGKFSNYFFEDPLFVAGTNPLALALFAMYGLIGYIVDAVFLSNNKSTRGEKKDERLAAFISMSYVNNILVAFSPSHFLGARSQLLPHFTISSITLEY